MVAYGGVRAHLARRFTLGWPSGQISTDIAGLLPAPHVDGRNASGLEKPWVPPGQSTHPGLGSAVASVSALALLYVWHVATGSEVIKRGWRYLVDCCHRRTLSVFRIGCDSLKRHLAFGHPVRIRLLP